MFFNSLTCVWFLAKAACAAAISSCARSRRCFLSQEEKPSSPTSRAIVRTLAIIQVSFGIAICLSNRLYPLPHVAEKRFSGALRRVFAGSISHPSSMPPQLDASPVLAFDSCFEARPRLGAAFGQVFASFLAQNWL